MPMGRGLLLQNYFEVNLNQNKFEIEMLTKLFLVSSNQNKFEIEMRSLV